MCCVECDHQFDHQHHHVCHRNPHHQASPVVVNPSQPHRFSWVFAAVCRHNHYSSWLIMMLSSTMVSLLTIMSHQPQWRWHHWLKDEAFYSKALILILNHSCNHHSPLVLHIQPTRQCTPAASPSLASSDYRGYDPTSGIRVFEERLTHIRGW